MSNEKELRKTFKEYKQYYLKGMNWKTKETFKEWFKRMKDIDSYLINRKETMIMKILRNGRR
jgi:hypothetical protein